MTYKFLTARKSDFTHYFCCFLFLIGASFLYAQNNTAKIPFTTAIELLEKKFEVKFAYNSKSAKRYQVSSPDINDSLTDILSTYTIQDSIVFKAVGNRYITVQFPTKYLNFCATFIDTQTGTPINNAVVYNGTTSYFVSEGGNLRIENISEESVLEVYINDMYSRTITIYNFYDPSGKCPLLFINQDINQLPTVSLKSYISKGIQKTNNGTINIKNNNFEILPSLIEPDVLQIAQVLPGVESYNETASNINIRGGASDELNIVWNDIRMYQTGHFFGLISAFNPNLIEDVVIYKNGTHPRYSEGVSGVLHMSPSSTVSEEVNGGIGINLSSINGFAKIPLSPTFAINVSGRVSINNGIGNPIYKSFFERTFQNTEITNLNTASTEEIRTTDENFNFYDVTISTLWDITKKDKLQYHFMTINNKLAFEERLFSNSISNATFNSLRQRSLVGGFNYQRNWSRDIKTILQYSASTYIANGDSRQQELFTESTQRNEVREQQVRADVHYNLSPIITIETGYQYTDTKINTSKTPENSAIPNTTSNTITTNAFYAQTRVSLFDKKTTLTVGGRYTQLTTLDNQLEPRLNIHHSITDHWNGFLAFETKHQSILQFTSRENQLLEIENREWFIANGEDNPLVTSNQFSIGSDYSKNNWTVSAEFFYKEVEGINTQNLDFRNQLQNTSTIGKYTVSGLEASLGKSIKNLSTWVSYTYQDNTYRFNALSPSEFRNNFDVTHSVTLATTYQFKKIKIAAGINYNSGLPFTTPLDTNPIIEVDGIPEIQYNTPNSDTLNPYFRTNISALYDFKMNDTFTGKLNIALLNVFNTRNALNSYFKLNTDENGTNTISRFDQFSLGFTPNISFQLFF